MTGGTKALVSLRPVEKHAALAHSFFRLAEFSSLDAHFNNFN